MRHLVIALGCLLGVCAIGCSESPTVPVTGTVTLDGQPASECEVMFTPKQGRPASAVTDTQGKFKLSTFADGDGAMPGEHTVTVCEHYPPGKAPPPGSSMPSRFPPEYADPTRTTFKANVERGSANDFKFDMKKSDAAPAGGEAAGKS